MIILHLSHTDILKDIRILRELEALKAFFQSRSNIVAIGIASNSGPPPASQPNGVSIKSINIPFSHMKIFAGTPKHVLTFITLFFSMMYLGIKHKPRIIHCHDAMILPIGVVLKLILGCKLVYDAHELESDRNGISKFTSYYVRSMEKLSWKQIDLLISVSPSIISWYETQYGQKINRLVLNSPDFKNRSAKKDAKTLRKLFSIPCPMSIFLYVGAIGKGRGIELLLDCFSDKRVNGHVIFIGWGELLGLVHQYEKEYKNIHSHMAVSHRELGELMIGADFGLCLIENVSLSDYFCIPNKLLEYALSGLFVLGSDFPEISSVINKYEIGQTASLNKKAIMKAIVELESKKKHKKPRDLSPLTWQSQAKNLVCGYNELLMSST